MTRQLLAIPAASATAERVFSFDGPTLSDLRKSTHEVHQTIMVPNGGLPVFLLVEVIFTLHTLNFVTNILFCKCYRIDWFSQLLSDLSLSFIVLVSASEFQNCLILISTSTGVRGRFISCSCTSNQRDCTVYRLKISGNSNSNSVHPPGWLRGKRGCFIRHPPEWFTNLNSFTWVFNTLLPKIIEKWWIETITGGGLEINPLKSCWVCEGWSQTVCGELDLI